MAFAEEDRDRVRQATNIVDLVAEVTTVRRSGRNHMAICVFHQEKSASMSLDPARGLFYCHGCHTSGDIFDFVMENRGLTFPEALDFLARRSGIALTEDPAARRNAGRRRGLVEAVTAAADFYNRRLMKGDDAGHARSYLRGRGYDSDVVATFKLGYAPSGSSSDFLIRELRSQGISESALVDAGLARKGRGGALFDYFRDRLMFPTNDVRGDPVGFGGRILGEGQPKYLNTPETAIYKKSRLLYGLDRARSSIQRAGEAVIVEGYTDVIACHISGVPTAVATNGTALGDDHFDLLRRFCDRIVLAFDADAAGAGAALRGETLSVPVNLDLDLRVAAMPPGQDPADLVQAGGADRLVESISESLPLLQFWIERQVAAAPIDEPEGRARALKTIGARLATISDGVARTEYARFVSGLLRVDLGSVEQAIGRPTRRRTASAPPRSQRTAEGDRVRVERELLRSLLAGRRDGVDLSQMGSDLFVDDRMSAAFQRVAATVLATPEGSPAGFVPADDEISKLLIEATMDRGPLNPVDDLVRRLRQMTIDGEITEKESQLSAVPADDQTSSPLFGELVRLRQARRKLEGSI